MMITAAILAGGQSRRMGTDKAVLLREGMTLLERTARVVLRAQLTVLVIGRPLPPDWPLAGVRFIEDETPTAGPLGGLLTALRHSEVPILALGCDMPLLTEAALRWLIAETVSQDLHDGLAVIREGQLEPLFSLYAPSCRVLAESRLQSGRLSLRGLIEAGEFRRVAAPSWLGAQLVNFNTPEDYARLLPDAP